MANSSRRTNIGGGIGLALTAGAIALAGAFAADAADWPQLRGDAQRTAVSSETVKPPLSVLWRFTGGYQNANTNSPVIAGDTAYFTTRVSSQQGGILFAIDAKNGSRKWSFPSESGLPEGAVFTSSPTIAGGKIYIGASDGGMYVVDASSGKEVLRLSIGRSINSSPVLLDGVLYFGANNGTMYALKPETGERAWTNKVPYNAGYEVISAPVIADSMILYLTADNSIQAQKLATGVFRWKYRLPYIFKPNSLIYADGSLIVPSGPRLFALLPTSGSLRWSADLPADILTAPVVSDGVIYVTCREDRGNGARLYAVKVSNGRAHWKEPISLPFAPTSSPLISGNTIYFATTRGMVIGVDKNDGKVLWQYKLQPSTNRAGTTVAAESLVQAPLAMAGGALYVVSNDGTLSALRADATDTTGPSASELYPRPGSSVNGKPPFIAAAKFVDFGTGLDPDSLKGVLDDRNIEINYDTGRNLVYFQTQSSGKVIDPPLANGRHTVTMTAKDFRGNETRQTWSFVVDNNIPKANSVAPVAPRSTNPPPPRPGGGNTRPPGRGFGNGN